jgi:hypothetical protein
MHRSGLGRPTSMRPGSSPRQKAASACQGVVRAMTAGSRRPPRPHTCWAEAPVATKALAPTLASDPRHPVALGSRNITTRTSGRRLRIWPRNFRTRRATRPNDSAGRRRTGRYAHGTLVHRYSRACLGQAVVNDPIADRASAGHAHRPHAATRSHRPTTCRSPQTSGAPDPNQTEHHRADPRSTRRVVHLRPAAHRMPNFGWHPNSDTAAMLAAS